MATPRQIMANRRNGALSRGPKTAAGKARSSLNALRHGLAARCNPGVVQQVEKMAQALVAEFGEASLSQARAAAQAQIDLLRVRDIKARIFDGRAATRDSDSSSIEEEDDEVFGAVAQLARLDRYERRALSNRKRALREVDEIGASNR
jgi:hypothetical protein